MSINADFIAEVVSREGNNASVRGEERSKRGGTNRVWTIDPIDGTGEYVDDSIPDAKRTTCVGISLFVAGRLVLSVVNNPFRNELFRATATTHTLLNGRRLTCSSMSVRRGVNYDYADWRGAPFSLRGLERSLGKPLNVYSAIYQACMVAAGRSAFAAFPGDTIHDIAPSALQVARAGALKAIAAL